MKNVLLIIHLPRATPRVEGLVSYISEFDWQPIILTGTTSRYKDLPARIIETPYKDALGFLGRWFKIDPEKDAGQQIKNRLGATSRKSPLDLLLTLGGAIVNYPCPNKNWKPFALEAARKLIQEERIDAIISTSAPVIGHIIASKLKAEYGIPWIADLRDLWSQNHNYTYGPIRRMMDRRLELKTFSIADALVTVSQPWAEKLSSLHNGRQVYTITNGFDPEMVNEPPVKLTTKFTITYTGLVHQRHDPSKLLETLRDLISAGMIDPDDIELRFYGQKQSWLEVEIKQFGLSNTVKQFGVVSKEISLEMQRESQLLLLFDWEDPQEKGVHSAKIFEYLGAGRPILATGGSKDDVVGELLNETKAGIHAPALEEIKSALMHFYQEYKSNGDLDYRGEKSEINKYSYLEMAREFSQILDSLT